MAAAGRSRSRGARNGGDRRERRRVSARPDRSPAHCQEDRLDKEAPESGGEPECGGAQYPGGVKESGGGPESGSELVSPALGEQGIAAEDRADAEPDARAAEQARRQGELRAADPEAVARLICLRQLTAAPRTRAQLAETLRRRGVPEDAAEAVLGRFTEVGLIDDATFASAWVESRHHGRGLGRRALAAELNQRGVGRDDINAAVAMLSQETELATARALVARRLAAAANVPAQTRMRRLVGMLARKGYPAGLAYRVVREALEQDSRSSARDGLDTAEIDEDEFINAELAAGDPD